MRKFNKLILQSSLSLGIFFSAFLLQAIQEVDDNVQKHLDDAYQAAAQNAPPAPVPALPVMARGTQDFLADAKELSVTAPAIITSVSGKDALLAALTEGKAFLIAFAKEVNVKLEHDLANGPLLQNFFSTNITMLSGILADAPNILPEVVFYRGSLDKTAEYFHNSAKVLTIWIEALGEAVAQDLKILLSLQLFLYESALAKEFFSDLPLLFAKLEALFRTLRITTITGLLHSQNNLNQDLEKRLQKIAFATAFDGFSSYFDFLLDDLDNRILEDKSMLDADVAAFLNTFVQRLQGVSQLCQSWNEWGYLFADGWLYEPLQSLYKDVVVFQKQLAMRKSSLPDNLATQLLAWGDDFAFKNVVDKRLEAMNFQANKHAFVDDVSMRITKDMQGGNVNADDEGISDSSAEEESSEADSDTDLSSTDNNDVAAVVDDTNALGAPKPAASDLQLAPAKTVVPVAQDVTLAAASTPQITTAAPNAILQPSLLQPTAAAQNSDNEDSGGDDSFLDDSAADADADLDLSLSDDSDFDADIAADAGPATTAAQKPLVASGASDQIISVQGPTLPATVPQILQASQVAQAASTAPVAVFQTNNPPFVEIIQKDVAQDFSDDNVPGDDTDLDLSLSDDSDVDSDFNIDDVATTTGNVVASNKLVASASAVPVAFTVTKPLVSTSVASNTAGQEVNLNDDAGSSDDGDVFELPDEYLPAPQIMQPIVPSATFAPALPTPANDQTSAGVAQVANTNTQNVANEAVSPAVPLQAPLAQEAQVNDEAAVELDESGGQDDLGDETSDSDEAVGNAENATGEVGTVENKPTNTVDTLATVSPVVTATPVENPSFSVPAPIDVGTNLAKEVAPEVPLLPTSSTITISAESTPAAITTMPAVSSAPIDAVKAIVPAVEPVQAKKEDSLFKAPALEPARDEGSSKQSLSAEELLVKQLPTEQPLQAKEDSKDGPFAKLKDKLQEAKDKLQEKFHRKDDDEKQAEVPPVAPAAMPSASSSITKEATPAAEQPSLAKEDPKDGPFAKLKDKLQEAKDKLQEKFHRKDDDEKQAEVPPVAPAAMPSVSASITKEAMPVAQQPSLAKEDSKDGPFGKLKDKLQDAKDKLKEKFHRKNDDEKQADDDKADDDKAMPVSSTANIAAKSETAAASSAVSSVATSSPATLGTNTQAKPVAAVATLSGNMEIPSVDKKDDPSTSKPDKGLKEDAKKAASKIKNLFKGIAKKIKHSPNSSSADDQAATTDDENEVSL